MPVSRAESRMCVDARRTGANAPLDKLRAHFGEWTGAVQTYDEMKDARRDVWQRYLAVAPKRDR